MTMENFAADKMANLINPKHLSMQLSEFPSSQSTVIGAAVFSSSSPHKLLVVKRADTESDFPGFYELPGGHVEPQDSNVREAVVRELKEETNLGLESVQGEIEELHWTSAKSGKRSVQFNYVVSVKTPEDVKLNPSEHSEYKWLESHEVDALQTKDKMRVVIRNAFQFQTQKLAKLAIVE